MYKVCVLTGTRADYGLLRELLFRLKANREIDLKLIVTGSHLDTKFGKEKLCWSLEPRSSTWVTRSAM